MQCQKNRHTIGIHGTDQLCREERNHALVAKKAQRGFGLIDTKLTDFNESYNIYRSFENNQRKNV